LIMWLECRVEGALYTPEFFSALLAEFSNSFTEARPPDLLPGKWAHLIIL
jgi:hypothetical protein